ncbi:hypothetical protein BH24ACI4_BH24ACI4_33070 [soil metagenome]
MLKRFGIGTMAGVVMALTMPHPAVTFSAGTAPSVGGTYHEGGAGTVLALPTDVQERKWGTGLREPERFEQPVDPAGARHPDGQVLTRCHHGSATAFFEPSGKAAVARSLRDAPSPPPSRL